MNEKQQKLLLNFLKAMEGGAVQPDELENVINAIMDAVSTHRNELEEKMKSESGSTATRMSEMLSQLNEKEAHFMDMIGRLDQGAASEFARISGEMKAEMERMEKMMADMKAEMKKTHPDHMMMGMKMKEVEKKIPSASPEFIRDQLESISREEDKLEIDAVRDLTRRLKELEKKISLRKNITIFGGGSSGGKIVKVYDLSDQLNGVLKTFSLPSFWRVISVSSSSFPNAFRPTTDYTTDASAMTITFTSEIEASTTLNTGQTLIVVYAE